MRTILSRAGAGLMLAAITWGGAHAAKAPKPADRVPVDLYVMSLCPFGVQAENGLLPVAEALKGYVDVRIHYIASEVEGSTGPIPTFRALHGQPEVDENIRQLCVQKHFPAQHPKYLLKRNESYKSPDWQSAAKAVGVDVSKIEACASGAEGAGLHAKSIKGAIERKANSSPTIDIAGKPYQASRSQRAFAEALCGVLKEKGLSAPACGDLSKFPGDVGGPAGNCGPTAGGAAAAPPAEFQITMVTEKACTVCGTSLEDVFKRQHPAAKFKALEPSSEEGKALLAKHHASVLPFYFMDKGVEKDPNFNSLLNQFYAKSGDGYVVKPGPTSFSPQIQMARKRVPNHLDIFVQPLSSFAVQSEAEFMRYLKTAELKDITLSFHFIVEEGVKADSKSGAKGEVRAVSLKDAQQQAAVGPLIAARGEMEVQEALRQACLFQKAPIAAFLAYLDCRNQNLGDVSRATACLQADEGLKACIQGEEGKALLRKDAALVRDLEINTSVSVLWENRFGPFGWHEVDWKKLISK